ncbi:testis-expressed protein 101 [Trichosurus vulpecula]|uniref:testis-expressed protein 101 n=1 Tax=Trichosurus vulpecula TaxID=9337 RepID=UPI00186AE76B|nr:testis-expressed protein 101 [Trichosurus vulpecula]
MAPCHARLPLCLFLLGAALALSGALTCNRGVLIRIGKNPTKFLANWTELFKEECKEEDLCQDTILIFETELQGIIIATKGCFLESVQEPTVVKYTQPPGVSATSYTHFCSTDYCNNYTDPTPLTEPPRGAVSPHQEGLMCPTCVSLGPCVPGSPVMHCPKLTLSCYSGTIMIKGGGIWTPVDLEGCMGEIECRVLNKTHTLGPLELTELCDRSSLFEDFRMDCGSCVLPAFVWALGLGSLLIL